jgi:hypothetical protein
VLPCRCGKAFAKRLHPRRKLCRKLWRHNPTRRPTPHLLPRSMYRERLACRRSVENRALDHVRFNFEESENGQSPAKTDAACNCSGR